MRWIILGIGLITFTSGWTQTDRGKNQKPEIVGQKTLSTPEDNNITIGFSDLYVIDWDNIYPWGFTMQLYPGGHYTLWGNTVIPDPNFYGTLTVPVTVNDGQDDSKRYDLKIEVQPVNDPPVITAQRDVSVNQNQPVAIQLNDLTVSDPDNVYPNGFSLSVSQGANYTASGNTITPSQDFSGVLYVSVVVNDGSADSAPFSFKITVNHVSAVPEIVGQVPLTINEDETITILLSYLKVVDAGSHYPTGFSLSVLPGSHYTVDGNTIKPEANFFGNLSAPVSVNDGAHTSEPYNITIIVTPINDAPEITFIEIDPLNYNGAGPANITKEFQAVDVDDDTLSVGEVKFDPSAYENGKDQLYFSNTANIRGVFDANNGILSLIGRGSVQQYVEAVRSITYSYSGDASGQKRTLSFSLNDGKNESASRQRDIVMGEEISDLDIPTGFTPNGDFVNDTWSVRPSQNVDAQDVPTIRVYTKSGLQVFETVGFNKEWDGRFKGEILPPDTYFYTIDLNLNRTKKFNGSVTILR